MAAVLSLKFLRVELANSHHANNAARHAESSISLGIIG
jgi:hypothetical protein